MAAIPVRYIGFMVTSVISILCVIYYATLNWTTFALNYNFYIIIASLPYTIYMFFYEFKSEKRENLKEGLINETHANFMIDTYCKYLFPFLFGNFLYTIIVSLLTQFEYVGVGVLLWLVYFWGGFLLPIIAILDLYVTARRRNHATAKDLLIIIIICLGYGSYSLVTNLIINFDITSKIISGIIGYYLILTLVTVNGYIFYDYINHRNSGSHNYSFFKVTSQTETRVAHEEKNSGENKV